MKQSKVFHRTISGADFYISPFAAMTSANLSAEVFSLLAPLLSSLIPLVGAISSNADQNKSIEDQRNEIEKNAERLLDNDIDKYLPGLVTALNGLSGDKLEGLISKLLILNHNIAVEYDYEDDNGDTRHSKGQLTKDALNEIFCMDVFGLYRLVYEVIVINFGGFFPKQSGQSGKVAQDEVIRIQA